MTSERRESGWEGGSIPGKETAWAKGLRQDWESRVIDVAGAKVSAEEMFTLSHGIKVQIHILKNSLFFSLTLQLIIHDICYIDINILELLAFRNRC